jgi:hypothetical protein
LARTPSDYVGCARFAPIGVYDIGRGFGDLTVPHSTSVKVRRLAAALLAFVALGSGSAWFINKYFGIEAQGLAARLCPRSTANQVEARQLHAIAGWFSIDCGHVRHREDADPAIVCAHDALLSRRRFYVAFDYVGTDSHGVTGLARNSKGEVYEVTTDDLGRGIFGTVSHHARTVTVTRCTVAPTERTSYPANRYLTCFPE